jgi:hypothetical protein
VTIVFEHFYEYIFKGRGKVFLIHSLKAHGEFEVYFHTFTTALDGSEWSVFDALAMQK